MTTLLDNPFMLHLVWRGLILPGLATLAAGLILLVLAGRTQNRGGGSFWALPLLAGLLTGYFSVYRDWTPWPHTVLGWLPALAVTTAVLASWTAYRRERRFGWLVVAVLVAAASSAMLDPMLSHGVTLSVLGELAWVAVLWWLLWMGWAGGHGDQRSVAATQIVLATGLAAVGPLSQSILLGQLAMVFGASWAVVITLSWLFRADTPLAAPVADLGALVLGVLYIELWYYDAAPWRVVLTLLAAAAIGVAAHRLYQRRVSTSAARALNGLIIPAVATALPLLVGVYFAWQTYTASSGGY